MTKEDIEFLKQLKRDILEGDRVGQAEPAFWMIKEKGWRRTDEDDGYPFYWSSYYSSEVKDLADFKSQLKQIIRNDSAPDNTCYDDEIEALGSMDECWEWACDNDLGDCFDKSYRERYDFLSQMTGAFLTKEDADEYVRRYGYNHDESAHSYALTAIRNPRFKRLWDIVTKTDWDEELKKMEN